MISPLALRAARWVSSDRRRTTLETAPRCLGTTASHTGRDSAAYVVGIGAGRRLATICGGCAAVYRDMGAAIQPERRSEVEAESRKRERVAS